jgi:hypothetical protein
MATVVVPRAAKAVVATAAVVVKAVARVVTSTVAVVRAVTAVPVAQSARRAATSRTTMTVPHPSSRRRS